MKITAIIGRAGSGKSHVLFSQAWENIRASESRRIKFLVPEQATHQAERRLLSPTDIHGCLTTEVLSFTRLAHRLDTGDSPRIISEIEKRFILASILRNRDLDTEPFSSVITRPGFVTSLSGQIKLLKRAGTEDTDGISTVEGIGRLTKAKLDFVLRILSHYNRELKEHNLRDPEDCLDELALKVSDDESLAGVTWFIDSFSGFTPQEKSILEGIFRIAEDVKIALCLDPEFLSGKDKARELFEGNLETLSWIRKRCKDNGYRFDSQPVPAGASDTRFRSKGIGNLEKNLFSRGSRSDDASGVSLIPVRNSREASRRIAFEIKSLVAKGGRYRDIAVVLRSHGDITDHLQEAFESAGISGYVDRRETLKEHPLSRLVVCLWELILRNFHREDLMELLRTGLVPAEPREIDLFENYLLQYGLNFDQITREWLDPEKVLTASRKEQRDELREIAEKILTPLNAVRRKVKEIQAGSGGVGEYVSATIEFLESWKVSDRMSESSASEMIWGLEEQRIYTSVVEVLESISSCLGDDRMSAAEFTGILKAAMDVLSAGHIPLSLDAVEIGEIHRSRIEQADVVFVYGLEEGEFPRMPSGTGLFDDRELDALSNTCSDWAIDYSRFQSGEEYLFYIACTRAREKLFLLYPGMDSEKSPSLFLSDVRRVLGKDKVELETDNRKPILNFGEMAGMVVNAVRAGDRSDETKSTYEYLVESDIEKINLPKIFSSLSYSNKSLLSPSGEKTRKLNLKSLDASRLIAFAACPFKYFARYDLGLGSRKVSEITPRETGTFVHAVLERCFKKWFLESKKIELDDISRFAEEAVSIAREVARDFSGGALIDGAREELRLESLLIPLIRDYVISEIERLRESSFKPQKFEWRFGAEGRDGLELDIPKGGKILLRGILDRVDISEVGNEKHAIAMDYKVSSHKSGLPAKIELGLEMQIPIYLMVLKDILGVKPVGGIFAYLSKTKGYGVKATPGSGFVRRGLFISDIPANSDEPVIGMKNDGVDEKKFEKILQSAHDRIIEYICRLLDGEINLWPCNEIAGKPCTKWCDYPDFCRYDTGMNPLRHPKGESRDE